jgi:SAM-dependent methyltransferase
MAADSAIRSRAFYRALGLAGLAIRTKPDWDAQIVATLVPMLPAGGRVLDVGCGYGRIAVPLAGRGFLVTGLDIAPNLLLAARSRARQRGLSIRFDQGSMTTLPYADGSFDAAICLWSAFYELTEEAEQTAALREMRRVLRPGGVAVIEGPVFEGDPSDRVRSTIIAGHPNVIFAHDAATLEARCADAGIADPAVEELDWAGRRRQVLRFRA